MWPDLFLKNRPPLTVSNWTEPAVYTETRVLSSLLFRGSHAVPSELGTVAGPLVVCPLSVTSFLSLSFFSILSFLLLLSPRLLKKNKGVFVVVHLQSVHWLTGHSTLLYANGFVGFEWIFFYFFFFFSHSYTWTGHWNWLQVKAKSRVDVWFISSGQIELKQHTRIYTHTDTYTLHIHI